MALIMNKKRLPIYDPRQCPVIDEDDQTLKRSAHLKCVEALSGEY